MLQPGTVIDNRYEVVRLLGRGGMSNIYVCRDVRLRGKTWVVKEMTARYSDPAEQRLAEAHFRREADILSSLDHRNLPTVNDYLHWQGKYYLVMEHVEGEDLGRILSRVGGPLPERQVTEWAVQIATVLYYLHCHKPDPIIFRDVKPSNIMIGPSTVKLIDFGIARHFDPSRKGDTMRIGSPGYAPPEQYQGQTDQRSDIYALGVTLHHALTGLDPTTTQTPFRLPPVRELNPAVTEEMARIVERATRLDPEERYASALEMKRDLQKVLQLHRGGTQVVSPPQPSSAAPAGDSPPRTAPPRPSPARPGGRAAGRGRLPWPRLLAGLLILGSLAGLLLFPAARRIPVESVQELLQRLFEGSGTEEPAPVELYLRGAPLGAVLARLREARRRRPDDGLLVLYQNNAVAEAAGARTLGVGLVVPQGADQDALLRGAALAQRVLNGWGGVRGRKLILVLERPDPGHLKSAVSRLLAGRSGRSRGERRGQPVEAVLVFGGGADLRPVAEILGRSSRPAGLVGGPRGALPAGPVAWLAEPPPPVARRVAGAVEAGRRVRLLSPALLEPLRRLGVDATTAETPSDGTAARDLFAGPDTAVVAPAASGRLLMEGRLKSGRGSLLLLADSPEELPRGAGAVPARALVLFSPMAEAPLAAAFARHYPVVYRGASPDIAAARAYDALAWLAQVRLGGESGYRGALLEMSPGDEARAAPGALYRYVHPAWVFQEKVEP